MSAWRWLVGRRPAEEELRREVDAHIAERIDDLVEDGMSEADARTQARREFGNRALTLERSREAWIAPWLSSLAQDLRYAVRTFTRQPGFAVSVIGILALGIGPVATLFTFFNAILLRPWPVREPSSILIVKPVPTATDRYGTLSNLEYRYLRDHSRAFAQLGKSMGAGGAISYRDTKLDAVQWNYVSANYLDLLRVRMQAGRNFLPEEEDYASPRPVAIISDRLWREYFGGSPSIVGDALFVEGRPFTVVGVTEPRFFDVDQLRRDVWMPLPSQALRPIVKQDAILKMLADPHQTMGQVAGRLAPGRSSAEAVAELDVLGRQFRRSVGMDAPTYRLSSTRPASLQRDKLTRQLPVMLLMIGALLLVMLLASANVGNLLLARGLSRQREIAIRLSIGAGRWRIVRQLLTEALLLSIIAGTAGLAIGAMGLRIFVVGARPNPLLANPDLYMPDIGVSAFALAMALLTCIAAAVLPALRSTRIRLAGRAGDAAAGRAGAGRLRTMLLAAQLAVSMVLLLGAGLLTRALGHAMTADPGFAIHDVQAISVRLPDGASSARIAAFYQNLRQSLETGEYPMAALSEFSVLSGSGRFATLRRADAPLESGAGLLVRDVSARYFSVLGIPLLAGRTFAPFIDGGVHEVVVNESAARLFWPEGSPLGRRLYTGHDDTLRSYTVTGVVKDVPVQSLSEIRPVVYQPMAGGGLVLVRDRSRVAVDRIASLVRGIEPAATVTARPLADDIREATDGAAAANQFAWSIGAVALLLSTVGAFGVFSFSVEERRREIGVRMALGARPPQILWTVIGSARWALGLGIGGGLLLALLATPVLKRFLFGLSPFDPIAYAGVTGLLATAALAATWVPARRAAHIDPAVTLRAD